MDEDQTSIEQVLAGDVEAFRGLVERHQRRVFGFVRNLVRHGPDAEDLVQDVFVAAFQKLDSFDAQRSQFTVLHEPFLRGLKEIRIARRLRLNGSTVAANELILGVRSRLGCIGATVHRRRIR